ncbi:MAG: hypothetical protein ABW321_32915 [Polyangiales bacterium]
MSDTRPAPPFAVGFGSLAGIGFLVRVWAFLVRGALWNDEAGLGLNIVGRQLAEVARPFVYQQYAPYLYVLTTKLLVAVAGPSEHVLRLLSVVAGCMLLPAMLLLARAASGWSAALFALALLVPNPTLVRYASELKPYASDALIATVLCLLTLRILQQTQRTRGALLTLAIAGILASWCSLPAVFVLAGCGAALLVDAERNEWPAVLGLGLVWGVSFVLHYLGFLQASASDSAYVERYWSTQDAFAPLVPHSLAELRWYPAKFFYTFDIFISPGGRGLRYLAGGLWLWGMFLLWRTQRPLCVLFVTPWLLLVVASGLHKYIVADRMLLFMVPMVVTPVVVALAELAQLRGMQSQLLAAALAVLFCAGPSLTLARSLTAARPRTGIDQVVQYLRKHYRKGDRLYVEKQVEWIYAFYARRLGFAAPFPIPDDGLYEPTPRFDTLDSLRGSPRAWVIVPTVSRAAPVNELATSWLTRGEALVTTRLNGYGKVVDMLDGDNTHLYLYDLTQPN